jgi:hypothetical protein
MPPPKRANHYIRVREDVGGVLDWRGVWGLFWIDKNECLIFLHAFFFGANLKGGPTFTSELKMV